MLLTSKSAGRTYVRTSMQTDKEMADRIVSPYVGSTVKYPNTGTLHMYLCLSMT